MARGRGGARGCDLSGEPGARGSSLPLGEHCARQPLPRLLANTRVLPRGPLRASRGRQGKTSGRRRGLSGSPAIWLRNLNACGGGEGWLGAVNFVSGQTLKKAEAAGSEEMDFERETELNVMHFFARLWASIFSMIGVFRVQLPSCFSASHVPLLSVTFQNFLKSAPCWQMTLFLIKFETPLYVPAGMGVCWPHLCGGTRVKGPPLPCLGFSWDGSNASGI